MRRLMTYNSITFAFCSFEVQPDAGTADRADECIMVINVSHAMSSYSERGLELSTATGIVSLFFC